MLRRRLFSIAVPVVGALALNSATGDTSALITHGSHSDVPRSCYSSFDTYSVPKSFLARCGDKIYPLARVEHLPGGGSAYFYGIDGTQSVVKIPPRGFNPLKSSTGRLAEYGYPPRPSGGQALRSWETMVGGAHFITPPKYQVGIPRVRISPRESISPNFGVVYSAIWAGNMATVHTYQDVYANWLEPHYVSTPCPNPVANSNWVGLGGHNTGTLAQAGTAVGEEAGGVGSHQAWYEMISGSTNIFIPIKGLYATPGGEFTAEVDHLSGGYDVFLKNDYTGATPGTIFVSFNHFDGSTAEMITEDPFGGWQASGYYLEKFNSFTVEDAEASEDGVNYHGLAWFDHDDVIMKTDQQMAHAGAASNSGDTWTFYFDHCS